MTLNCAVVDDSMIQRLYIVKLIKNHPSLNLIADYGSALETKTALKRYKIDLLFLDIEMPVINGFDLLDMLKDKPQVIFITGKKGYSEQAQFYSPTDFILKPVSQNRLNEAVEKAKAQHQLIHADSKKGAPESITVQYQRRFTKINFRDIKWIESIGEYIKILTLQKTVIVHQSIDSIAKELPADKFLRVLKSHIINLDQIDSFKISGAKYHPANLGDSIKSFLIDENYPLSLSVYKA